MDGQGSEAHGPGVGLTVGTAQAPSVAAITSVAVITCAARRTPQAASLRGSHACECFFRNVQVDRPVEIRDERRRTPSLMLFRLALILCVVTGRLAAQPGEMKGATATPLPKAPLGQ